MDRLVAIAGAKAVAGARVRGPTALAGTLVLWARILVAQDECEKGGEFDVERILPFSAEHLQAACKVLGDTDRGLTGSEIGYLLGDVKVTDVDPEMTKWKRLFNAMAGAQNTHQVGNHLIMFINRAMNPVSYARDRQTFEWRRDELNVVLAFSGFYIREDGKVVHSARESTLIGARSRAGRMRAALEQRNVHTEVLKYCRAEFIQENYFHAVLEAVKGVGERIRALSGLVSDGAELVNGAFGISVTDRRNGAGDGRHNGATFWWAERTSQRV